MRAKQFLCFNNNGFGTSKIHLSLHPMAKAAVRFKAVYLLFIVVPLVCGGSLFGSCFLFSTL